MITATTTKIIIKKIVTFFQYDIHCVTKKLHVMAFENFKNIQTIVKIMPLF